MEQGFPTPIETNYFYLTLQQKKEAQDLAWQLSTG
jgi:hypothetical protein